MDESTWRERVERELGGADFEKTLVTPTREGIDVRPLYTRDGSPLAIDPDSSAYPGVWPFTRGGDPNPAPVWRCAVHDDVDLDSLRKAIARDLRGGADTIQLRFDRAARLGFDAGNENASEHVGKDGVTLYSTADLGHVLGDVDVESVRFRLDAGANALVCGGALLALLRRREVDPSSVTIHFGADPIASLARDGWLPGTLEVAGEEMTRLAIDCDESYPDARAVSVSSRPYHFSCATAAQEAGFAIATAVHYLRRLEAGGLDVEAAARQIAFEMVVGRDTFMEIAKLRAMRLLFAKVLRACGCGDPPPAWIFAETSYRTLTRRDPWVNMLRGTTQAFAAMIGGADAIAVTPFDAALGRPDRPGRRLARNTISVLAEESHLDAVVDPAGGAYYVEALTDALAREAWTIFREIETEGGMPAALERGDLLERVTGSHEALRTAVERRKLPILGVSEFADSDDKLDRRPQGGTENDRVAAERRVSNHRVRRDCEPPKPSERSLDACAEAMAAGATIGEVSYALRGDERPPAAMEAFSVTREADPFEALRDTADRLGEASGRPTVFLANLGPLAEHATRAAFARDFFRAAGFTVESGDGTGDDDPRSAAEALAENASGEIAVLCGTDERYSTHAATAAERLRRSGRDVILAGRPGGRETELRDAGVDHFIHLGCNAWRILRELLADYSATVPGGEE